MPVPEFRAAFRHSPVRDVRRARTPSGKVSMGRAVWPTARPTRNRNTEWAENAFCDALNRLSASGSVAFREITQHDSRDGLHFAGLFQMH